MQGDKMHSSFAKDPVLKKIICNICKTIAAIFAIAAILNNTYNEIIYCNSSALNSFQKKSWNE